MRCLGRGVETYDLRLSWTTPSTISTSTESAFSSEVDSFRFTRDSSANQVRIVGSRTLTLFGMDKSKPKNESLLPSGNRVHLQKYLLKQPAADGHPACRINIEVAASREIRKGGAYASFF